MSKLDLKVLLGSALCLLAFGAYPSTGVWADTASKTPAYSLDDIIRRPPSDPSTYALDQTKTPATPAVVPVAVPAAAPVAPKAQKQATLPAKIATMPPTQAPAAAVASVPPPAPEPILRIQPKASTPSAPAAMPALPVPAPVPAVDAAPASTAATTLMRAAGADVAPIPTRPEADVVPISMSSMVMFALDDSPEVRMALAREDAADAKIGKARSKYFPLIDIVSEGGQAFDKPSSGATNGNSVYTWRHALTATQTLYDFDKTSLAVGQQRHLEQSSKLDTQVNVEDTMNRTIEAYLKLLRYQTTLDTSADFLVRLRALNDTIRQMYEAGASSKTTLDYANARLSAAESDLGTLKANINDAKAALEFLVGPLPDNFKTIPPDDLDPTRLDLSQYTDIAAHENTGIQLSASDLEALRVKLKIARAAFYPDFKAIFSAESKFNDGGRTMNQDKVKGIVQFNYRLYDGGARSDDVHLARAQLKESAINQEKILKELRMQIRQSYNQVVSLQQKRAHILEEIASSSALQKLNRENFKLGSINVIELIEGEERLNAAYTKLHKQDSDLYLNVYRLLITAGLLKQNFFCDTCGQGTVASTLAQ